MAEILVMVSVLMLPKDLDKELMYGLSHKEFRCRCERETCHYTLVAQSLLDSYWKVRFRIAMGLDINSGHRCQAHNEEVGGSETSSHTTGHAIDISTENMSARLRKKLIRLTKEYFDFVIVYPTFIHCHNKGE